MWGVFIYLFINHFQKSMKKKCLILSVMLTCLISMFTSCVQSDMYELYDEDGTEWLSPRRKGTKDNGPQQLPGDVNPYGSQYGYHRVVSYNDCGCTQRALNARFGSAWQQHIVAAVEEFVASFNEEEAKEYISKYYTNGAVDVSKFLNACGIEVGITASIITKSGGNSSGKRIYNLTCCNHCVCIVRGASLEEAGGNTNCGVDMDGNVWNEGMLEVYP